MWIFVPQIQMEGSVPEFDFEARVHYEGIWIVYVGY